MLNSEPVGAKSLNRNKAFFLTYCATVRELNPFKMTKGIPINLFTFIFAISLSSLAHAADTTVVTCLKDARPYDGPLESLLITKNIKRNFSFDLLVQGSGFGGGYHKETKVALSDCSFSKVYPGAGECIEVTADGFRGPNRLALALAYSEGRDLIRATVYTSTTNGEKVTQEVSFDLTACKFSK